MPKNATPEQRLRWHIAHARHCGCREMPESLRREISRLKRAGKVAKRR